MYCSPVHFRPPLELDPVTTAVFRPVHRLIRVVGELRSQTPEADSRRIFWIIASSA